MLYCPNPICQTPNPETHRFCQKCRTPLMRRYLWAVGTMASAYQAGDVLGDRFLCKGSRIFLDSKPGLPPVNLSDVPETLLPYLRLSSSQLHVPQLYDWLQLESETARGTPRETLLLLDQVPLYRPDSLSESGQIELPQSHSSNQEVVLFPSLLQMWQAATPFRQLHWLWQIAQLWQPLSQEQCASTLLNPKLLRVEGGLLRLLELEISGSAPSLVQLGQTWLDWTASARPEIRSFLQTLCQQVISGTIHNAEQLVNQLDWAIEQVAQSQTYRIYLATRTDQGPTRQRNEDACYPAPGREQSDVSLPLVIVCDGIGGHQGGDVASHLAIDAVSQHILSLQPETLDSTSLMIELEKAACLANDLISQRNDSEQRFDRQRMGTTIVMALVRHHELYIVHVGDSRAYWITQRGCHQITVDDDIAAREVRLGYSTYRQALQQPSAGALVQALGMVGSSMLYPTVQRFLLDEDSVFLLCSDGLCDNDRVEEVWDTEILPILDGKTNLLTVSRNLIDIGNTRNGYDNVTVGLLSCKVTAKQPIAPLPDYPDNATQFSSGGNRLAGKTGISGAPTQIAAPVQLFPTPQSQSESDPTSTATTRIIPRKPSRPRLLPWIFAIAALSGLAVALYPLLQEAFDNRQVAVTPEPLPAPSIPEPTTPTSLTVNALLRIRPATADPTLSSTPAATANSSNGLLLQARPAASAIPPPVPSPAESPTASAAVPASPVPDPVSSSPGEAVIGSIPAGSILEVLSKQGATAADQWVKLRVCSVPIVSPPTSSPTAAPAPSDPAAVVSPSPEGVIAASPAAPSTPAATPPEIAPVKPGQEGWLREADLLPIIALDVPTDRANCAATQPQPSSTP